jgi:hypothetical protein
MQFYGLELHHLTSSGVLIGLGHPSVTGGDVGYRGAGSG